MRKIFSSPWLLTVVYAALALILIVLFRLIFPGFPINGDVLPVFLFKAKLLRGLSNYINLFPALVMSALVLYFALNPHEVEEGVRFSTKFFESMKVPIITCVGAAVFYTICFLLFRPAIVENSIRYQNESRVYRESLANVKKYYLESNWALASYFGNICSTIWRDDPAPLFLGRSGRLKDMLPLINAEAYRIRSGGRVVPSENAAAADAGSGGVATGGGGVASGTASAGDAGSGGAGGVASGTAAAGGAASGGAAANQRALPPSSYSVSSGYGISPGAGAATLQYKGPLDATQALKLADELFGMKNYYDAAYLGNLAASLAPPGSVENARGRRMMARAWEEISQQSPSPEEEEAYSIYKRKKEGYEASLTNDWIGAYYIFKKLVQDYPQDKDSKNLFLLSEEHLKQISFFLDEMKMMFDTAQTDALFSMPAADYSGRMIIRIGALTNFNEFSLGRNLEVLAFNNEEKPVFKMTAPFIKIIPEEINGRWQTVILLKAIDRNNPGVEVNPEWTYFDNVDHSGSELVLPYSYEDFLLAERAKFSVEDFIMNDLFAAARTLGDAGFAPAVFYVEIVRQIYFPLSSLFLFVLALIIGWKFRATSKVSVSIPIMLIVMPIIFSVFVSLVRLILNFINIWSVLSFGFAGACVIAVAFPLVLFVFSLFLLAAQRGPAA